MDANHNNRYPSPPSSSNSPNVAEERVTPLNSSILRRATISAMSEASQETQRHLQQTSAALDAAYNRIYQVRRSLLDLSETLPETLSQLRLHIPDDQSALDHDADALSLPQNFESLSAAGLLERRDARERAPWNRVRPGSRNDRLSPHDAVSEGFSQLATDQSQVGTALSLSGNTLRSFTRVQANPPSRAAVQGDDGSTLLGRRVAARIANAPTVADAASATIQLMGNIGRIYEGTFNSIASVTRNYEDELESVRHIMNERRQTSPAVPSRSTPSQASILARSPSQGLPQLSPHSSSRGAPQSSSQAPPGSSLNPQWDLGPGNVSNNARQNSGPSERLSLLSNFSVQNLPTPSTSNLPSRPLIFDEPLSYVPPETVNPPSGSRYPPPESAFQGRNYVVHRTYDRNGEELVHNITVDWDDGDPMSWLMPSPVTSRRPRNRFSSPRRNLDVLRNMDPPPPPPPPPPQETTNTTNSNDLPRRRGWARLDLDGNEIPSDEEEEVERIRTESRMRASQRTQTLITSISLPGNMTPTPPPRELNIYQNIKPPVVLRHDPSLSYPADFVNPLPMPLSEMVDSGEKPKRQATLLPRHIIVAGR
ncbi:hypothetical protein P691DRAFT_654626 [Macrolepiota fuliginosa MF-IS2]|uniref:Uncharacterized protein n=1 Tax=Macrolepiota fuliginosa MF-IS2 TaxID=1400762 RepID=A0A9P5XSM1_9AGAR|nr:hypothetical protein P691DRAFT_654626 [Macrolepiota fuliginosa MF-IS2]